MNAPRLLNDPKPLVVGIAWVVECVEQRTRVDEDKFKIDLDLVNVAGTNKVGILPYDACFNVIELGTLAATTFNASKTCVASG